LEQIQHNYSERGDFMKKKLNKYNNRDGVKNLTKEDKTLP
jgi:hypothetical protein